MAEGLDSTSDSRQPETEPFNPDQHEAICGEPVLAKGVGNLGVSAALWQADIFAGCDHARAACPHIHTIAAFLHGEAEASTFIDGRLRSHRKVFPGDVSLVRVGESPRSVCHTAHGQYAVFYVPDALLQQSATDEFKQSNPLELLPHYYRRDPIIAQMGRLVASEIQAPSRGSQLMLDSVSLALVVRLLRSWSCPSERTDLLTAGLASWQQRRAIELLQSRYSENLSIAELAAEARLSPFHFIRSFKRSVGMPPHQYLTQIRLEHARVLLETTSLPVSDIASQIGYESPSYFAQLFRRNYGMTPKDYRRERNM